MYLAAHIMPFMVLQVVQYCREQTADESLRVLLQRAAQLVRGAASNATFMERQSVPYDEDADVKIGSGAAQKGWRVTVVGYRCGSAMVRKSVCDADASSKVVCVRGRSKIRKVKW